MTMTTKKGTSAMRYRFVVEVEYTPRDKQDEQYVVDHVVQGMLEGVFTNSHARAHMPQHGQRLVAVRREKAAKR